MKLNFLGDVFLDRAYKVDVDLGDFIFNLEYPLSTSGIPAKSKVNLGSDIPNIIETFGKFPKAVNLANNHIMDYGEEAFGKTTEYLNENNIAYFGAGNEENNYNNPCFLDFEGKKIALLGYSCPTTHAVFGRETSNGSALLDVDLIDKDIQDVKTKVDMVVVTLHWGDEEIKYPKATDVEKAHAIIDAGADMIIGHHAHVIQSIEKYKNKYIFYGLGNFIFPDLEVPSMYDGEKFLRRFVRAQYKPNRQTIVVGLDSAFNISYETLVFKNGIVKKKKVKIPQWIPALQKHYDLYKRIWFKKMMIEMFFRKPRIPNIRQIKLLLGVGG